MIYFIHIPKTAGMFVRKIIQENIKNNYIIDDYAQVAYLTDSQINKFDAILGHIGGAFLRRIINPKPVVFLRNPVDRMYSMYNYWRNTIEDSYTKYYSRQPFIEWLKSDVHEVKLEVDGGMAWQLAIDRSYALRLENKPISKNQLLDSATEVLYRCFFIGTQENLRGDVIAMCQKLGFKEPKEFSEINSSIKEFALSDSDRSIAEGVLDIDMDLFCRAKSIISQ